MTPRDFQGQMLKTNKRLLVKALLFVGFTIDLFCKRMEALNLICPSVSRTVFLWVCSIWHICPFNICPMHRFYGWHLIVEEKY